MKKNPTPLRRSDLQQREKGVVVPSAKTLSFLKSFARTYYVEKSLPSPLGELCIN